MSITYSYYREIYDIEQLFQYIKSSLNTINHISYNNGQITTFWPSILSSEDKLTLDTLISSYSNPQVIIENNPFRKVSVGNSTTTPLSQNATFNGYWEDISDYSSISIFCLASTNSTLYIDLSINGQDTHYSETVNLYANKVFSYCNLVLCKYFKIRITNSNSVQSSLSCQTIYHHYRSVQNSKFMNETIDESSLATICKSVISGKCTNGTYNDVSTTNNGELKVNIPFTAFGELMIASKYPIIQCNFLYGYNPQTSTPVISGSGTILPVSNYLTINSGSSTNSYAMIKTNRIARYRTGQGINMFITAIFDTPHEGNTQIFGGGNNIDGLFFGFHGTSFGILHRSFGNDQWIYQNDWNVDKMDGSGKSGIILDPFKGNVYNIQFQWLGFGMIKFFIEESDSGNLQLVHCIQYSNKNTITSLKYPIFPMIAESQNTTNNSNVSLKVICLNAFLEGTPKLLGSKFGFENTKSINTISSPFGCVFAIRNKTTFRGVPNNLAIYLTSLSCCSEDRTAVIKCFMNASLDLGSTWVDVNTNDSVVEYCINSATCTGNNEIISLILTKGNSTSMNFKDYDVALEPGECLVIGARVPSGVGSSLSAALNWIEEM